MAIIKARGGESLASVKEKKNREESLADQRTEQLIGYFGQRRGGKKRVKNFKLGK